MIGSHFQYVLIYHNVINYNWWIPNAYGWFSMNVEKPYIWSIFPVQIFLYILYSHILSIVKNQLSWSGFTYSHTLSIIPFCVYIYMYMIVLTVLLAILLVKIQYSHMLQQCYNCLNPVCYSHCIYISHHYIIGNNISGNSIIFIHISIPTWRFPKIEVALNHPMEFPLLYIN